MKLVKLEKTKNLWELQDDADSKGLAATMLTTDELIGIAKGLPPEILDEAGLTNETHRD